MLLIRVNKSLILFLDCDIWGEAERVEIAHPGEETVERSPLCVCSYMMVEGKEHRARLLRAAQGNQRTNI